MASLRSSIRGPVAPILIGVSLKMYFGRAETLAWIRRVAALARRHPAVRQGAVELFVLPSLPLIEAVSGRVRGARIRWGAQVVSAEENGAFTGEVSAALLRELGCDYVAIGHAERRRMFGEDDRTVARKVAAAVRHDLIPVLCVGERQRVSAAQAAQLVIRQLRAALVATPAGPVRIVAAYEPIWAIGAAQPADTAHITGVSTRVQAFLDRHSRLAGSRVIYGGSAGPGLLTALGGAVGGLFLGRFAHDPANLRRILDEAVKPNRARR